MKNVKRFIIHSIAELITIIAGHSVNMAVTRWMELTHQRQTLLSCLMQWQKITT